MIFHELNSRDGGSKIQQERNNDGFTNTKKWLDFKYNGWIPLDGFQLRYIYLIDKSCKITVPILPFSKIDEMGAGMYKGQKITQAERHNKQAAVAHSGERRTTSPEGAFDATVPLKFSVL